MKQTLLIFCSLIVLLNFSCKKNLIELDENQENTAIDSISLNSLNQSSFCFPPITIDTCDIQMQVEIDDVLYIPTANFACTLPNIFLGINQLWISGSTPPALKVISLIMPTDIDTGMYNLQLNSLYDARYVPSGSVNFSVDNGTLTIIQHDTTTKHIEGFFEFTATNLDSPVQPSKIFENGTFWAKY